MVCTQDLKYLNSFLKEAGVSQSINILVKDYKDYRGIPNFEGLKHS